MPDFKKITNKSIDREFLFGLVNTIDPYYFPDAMNEIEIYRNGMKAKKEKSQVMIDPYLYELIKSAKLLRPKTKKQMKISAARTLAVLKQGAKQRARSSREYKLLDLSTKFKSNRPEIMIP